MTGKRRSWVESGPRDEQVGGEPRRQRRSRRLLRERQWRPADPAPLATTSGIIPAMKAGRLATLYDHFGNKQDLLRSIIELRDEEDICPAYSPDCDVTPPTELIRAYAHRLYEHVTRPRAVGLNRIVITEALRDPVFARTLYDEIHLPAVRDLADTLRQLDQAGRSRVDDPMAAARLFFAIVMSDAQMNLLIEGHDGLLDPAGLDWRLSPFLSSFAIE